MQLHKVKSNPNSSTAKKWVAHKKEGYYEKRCEIQGGGTVMVGYS